MNPQCQKDSNFENHRRCDDEINRKIRAIEQQVQLHGNFNSCPSELLDRLKAAYGERDLALLAQEQGCEARIGQRASEEES